MGILNPGAQKVTNLVDITGAGFAAAANSLPVVPTTPQFLSTVTRIAGDDASHSFSAVTARFSALYDAYILEGSPTYGYGGATFLSIGYSASRRRGLVYFDLSALVGLTLSSATLWMYNTDNAVTTGNGTVNARRILTANSGWDEGGGHSGSAATLTEPSWNLKTQTPNAAWAGSAGLLTSGTDYSTTAMGSAAWTDGVAEWLQITCDTDEVEAMVAANAGILLYATDETASGKVVVVHSRDNATDDSYDPYLSVTVSGALAGSTSIFIVADSAGATWSNSASATTNDAPIPTTGLELPLYTFGSVGMSFFVPTGVNVWYAILGPK